MTETDKAKSEDLSTLESLIVYISPMALVLI